MKFGDLPGHEFHGNQYTGGAGGSKEHTVNNASDQVKHHDKMAVKHNRLSEAASRLGNTVDAQSHRAAALAHQQASQLYGESIGWGASKTDLGGKSAMYREAQAAGKHAETMSNNANSSPHSNAYGKYDRWQQAGGRNAPGSMGHGGLAVRKKFGRNVVNQMKRIGTRA